MTTVAPSTTAPAATGATGEKRERGFGKTGAEGAKPRGGPRGPRRGDAEEWKPVTKLGRLVSSGNIKNLAEIFKFSIPIKEYQIVEKLLPGLKEEVMQVKPVQKQTQAGQRTRFKAFVVVGDESNYIGLGWKCHKEVQGAIKGAIMSAKMSIVPIRKGYWGNKIGNTHTVPCKVTGKSGSVRVRLVPAPRGTGLVAPGVSKKLFQFAGIQDVYTKTEGKTRTKGNFIKATYHALKLTYFYNSPDFWGKSNLQNHPFVEHQDFLEKGKVAN
jgi:ribosomal protein uS5